MNMKYYKELRRKELIKNTVFIIFILLFAFISTYYIYNKFIDTRDEILKSESLEVSYHEKDGNKFSITKIIPISDNVGLSSKAYRFTIKNNTNTKVKYVINISEDKEKKILDDCIDRQIPLNIIKAAIHKKGEVSSIYNLDDLEDGNIEISTIEPRGDIEYTIRFWTSKNYLTIDDDLEYHYHGIIKVYEYDS